MYSDECAGSRYNFEKTLELVHLYIDYNRSETGVYYLYILWKCPRCSASYISARWPAWGWPRCCGHYTDGESANWDSHESYKGCCARLVHILLHGERARDSGGVAYPRVPGYIYIYIQIGHTWYRQQQQQGFERRDARSGEQGHIHRANPSNPSSYSGWNHCVHLHSGHISKHNTRQKRFGDERERDRGAYIIYECFAEIKQCVENHLVYIFSAVPIVKMIHPPYDLNTMELSEKIKKKNENR